MTRQNFIGKCVMEMIRDGMSVRFNKRIYDSKKSYSYFSEYPREFIISYFEDRNEDDWFHDFIHEYAHYIQFKNEGEKWEQYNKDGIIFTEYIANTRKRIALKNIRRVQELEADGNIKAEEIINKYKLKVKKSQYFKNNNLYIICHEFMVKYKVFFLPYCRKMLRLIPDTPMTIDEIASFPHMHKLEALYKIKMEQYFNK